MSSKGAINIDLQKERDKCTFDPQELTHLIDGGFHKTTERKKLEDIVLKEPGLLDVTPTEYLSHKELYEETIRKACILFQLTRRLKLDNGKLPSNLVTAVFKEQSPLLLHFDMFIPTIRNQGTEEQQATWVERAEKCHIIGTYAQTELGHGTFLRGLETTATYDPSNKEFILNSPALTSYKWWAGGLGQTVNHCIVLAQLYTQGKCHGIHPFVVQVRDEATHMPLPGIKVGEIGAKMGMNSVNQGFLGFDHYRIPRNCMLMKNSKVMEDGTYIKSPSSKLVYGTMVYVRVMIVSLASVFLSKAATVAVRFSAVRHQSQIDPEEPETQIINFVTQQHKILPAVAMAHAFRVTGDWLRTVYNQFMADLGTGNLDRLPELHALACCLKAVCSADSSAAVERCRLACGGHGYMTSSNLHVMYTAVSGSQTYEGENTVLLLQTARYLIKCYKLCLRGQVLTPTVSYIGDSINQKRIPWENSIEGIVKGFQQIAAGKIRKCYERLEEKVKSGMKYEFAWNATSILLTQAADAHARAILVSTFAQEIQNLLASVSAPLGKVLNQLVELYSVYSALEKTGDLLLYTSITQLDVEYLQTWYEDLLTKILPNAVGIVDAFDFRDEILSSTLGAYDGRVYERLMEEAMKSPLNKQPVNESFHKYLKPFMKSNI